MTERLADRLAGKRLLLTGATGFVGEALLERVLADLPDTSVMLLVRGRGGQPAAERVAGLLERPAFSRLRERVGGAEALADLARRRITVVDGDLDAVPVLPAAADVVIHCAGEVSFDPALDTAFRVNVHGTLGVLAAATAGGAAPHFVQVSTAYVQGRRLGPVPEARLDHQVDWQAEAAAAERLRVAVETESRSPVRLTAFAQDAAREHAPEGPQAVAADTEHRRHRWVHERLVEAGRQRARSLGWTDAYTFTKALAERALEQRAAGLPLTIVRPTIIESALSRPYPGWIEGFKMAEPLILAFGRGDIPEFPGNPDGIIDIVPVDLVVNAILAAAAHPPPAGSPAYLTVCSGARNPLRFVDLYRIVVEHFGGHPVDKQGLGPPRLPEWRWPGASRLDRLLRASERLHGLADRAVTSLPASPRARDWARRLDRRGRQLEFLRRYFDLYAPYLAGEVRFTDSHTQRLHAALHPDDAMDFGFDTAVIDWAGYMGEIHVPAVTAPLRLQAATSRPRPAPRRVPPRTDPQGRVVAVFDLDGTLLSGNVVRSYLWLRLPELPLPQRGLQLARLLPAVPGWLAGERRDRAGFLRDVYRRYAGADLAMLDRIVDEELTSTILTRLSPPGVRAIREHRAAGHRLVLISGAIRPLTRPVAPLFDEVIAADLDTDEWGRATGRLREPPLVGEARASWLRHRAEQDGWDLSASYAYADSATDLPMLRAVGHPVAVDPDVLLARAARRHGWPVETWRAGARRPDTVTVPARVGT